MKVHELIDRLARLDEAAVEEPVIEPGIQPEAPGIEPGTEPGFDPDRSPDPYELPPDFDPNGTPRPKAETEESEAIRGWLEATQQPVQDWEWDGRQLRLLLDDGTTEIYSRQQLDQVGIFDGEMAFAESEESSSECPCSQGVPEEKPLSVLDQILGRSPCDSSTPDELSAGPEVINIEGENAEKLNTAISDIVNAIMGIVGGETAPEEKSEEDQEAKKPTKSSKKGKKKEKDKDKDKDEDKDEDEDEDEDEEKDKDEDEEKE